MCVSSEFQIPLLQALYALSQELLVPIQYGLLDLTVPCGCPGGLYQYTGLAAAKIALTIPKINLCAPILCLRVLWCP